MKSPRRMGIFGGLSLVMLLLASFLPQGDIFATPPDTPVLLQFGHGYCHTCKEMEVIVGQIALRYREQLEVRVIHIELEEALSRKYKIFLVPTLVFLDTSGKEVYRHEGFWPEKNVLKKLKELGFIPGNG